jgi:uncharacterized membrane protein
VRRKRQSRFFFLKRSADPKRGFADFQKNRDTMEKKMKKYIWIWITLVLFLGWAAPAAADAGDTQPQVRGIVFYSPNCGHCHKLLTESLPPILERYGEQLQILIIDASNPQGGAMYTAVADYFEIPNNARGVPMMVIGETVLIGGADIPNQLPGIVDAALAGDGIDWPAVPALQEALSAQGIITADGNEAEPVAPAPAAASAADGAISADLDTVTENSATLTISERFSRDLAGNTLSVLILLLMIAVVFWVARAALQQTGRFPALPNWVMPLLILVGTAVAVYMSYVELTDTAAVCGPVGDCNTVQQSQYATLFGLIPIGVLGVGGYLLIGTAWLLTKIGPAAKQALYSRGAWLLTLGGTLFSIYLTFLEPFVIGATCAWCLSSAVIMSLLLIAASAPALQSFENNGRYANLA